HLAAWRLQIQHQPLSDPGLLPGQGRQAPRRQVPDRDRQENLRELLRRLRQGLPDEVRAMSTALLLIQILNGLQLGVLLFLVAAGLTLVFGVMDFINLAHGVQYMLGAYLAVTFYALTGNFLAALVLALVAALILGLALEFLVFRHLYERDHLDQVIAT